MNISNAKDISSREIDEKPDLGLKFPFIIEGAPKKFLEIKSADLPQADVSDINNKYFTSDTKRLSTINEIFAEANEKKENNPKKQSIFNTKDKVVSLVNHIRNQSQNSKGDNPKRKFSTADAYLNLMKNLKKIKKQKSSILNETKNNVGMNFIIDNGAATEMNYKLAGNTPNKNLSAKDIKLKLLFKATCQKIKFAIVKIFTKLLAFLPIASPSSIRLMLWRILISLLIMMNFFILSINFFFLKETENISYQEVISFTSIVCFFADMMLKCSTGFYENGLIIQERQQIVERYFSTSFFPDIVSLITLVIEVEDPISETNLTIQKIFQVLFFLKIWDIKLIFDQYQQMFSLSETFQALYSFFMLASGLLLVAHIFACGWFLVGNSSQDTYSDTWIKSKSLSAQGWGAKYITSLYWSLTTVLTVGYGDVTPQNPLEMLFTIIIMSFGCVVYGYLINQIGNILDKFNHSQKALKRSVNLIDNYMKRKQVNIDLRFKIKNYLEYIFASESAEQKKKVDSLIDKLPESLKDEFLWQTDGKYIDKLAFFQKNFSPEFIKKLIYVMRQNSYSPGDIINDPSDSNSYLYIIGSGDVEVNFGRGDFSIKFLKEGDMFGQYNFVVQEPLDLRIRSKNYSCVYTIKRKDFIDVLQMFPLDREKFCFMRDNLLLYKSAEGLEANCLICEKNHITKNCDLCFYRIDRELVLKNYKIENFQISRSKFLAKKRRNKRSLNALKLHSTVDSYPEVLMECASDHHEFLKSLYPEDYQVSESDLLSGEQDMDSFGSLIRKSENIFEPKSNERKNDPPKRSKTHHRWTSGNKSMVKERYRSQQILEDPNDNSQNSQTPEEEIPKNKFIISKALKTLEAEPDKLLVVSAPNNTGKMESSLKQSSSSRHSENNVDMKTEKSLHREGTFVSRKTEDQTFPFSKSASKAWILNSFDKGCNFEIYFPHNNMTLILESMRRRKLIKKNFSKETLRSKQRAKIPFKISTASPKISDGDFAIAMSGNQNELSLYQSSE